MHVTALQYTFTSPNTCEDQYFRKGRKLNNNSNDDDYGGGGNDDEDDNDNDDDYDDDDDGGDDDDDDIITISLNSLSSYHNDYHFHHFSLSSSLLSYSITTSIILWVITVPLQVKCTYSLSIKQSGSIVAVQVGLQLFSDV